MNIDNITSDSMTLTYNGKAMLIKVYEQEIQRLKDDNKYLNKVNIELSSEKNRLKSIIKEVREYIKKNEFYLDYKTGACIKGVMPLLKILDKEE